MYKIVNVTIFSFPFWKIMSFFSLKTDQNCLGLSKIVLADGTDNSAVHSFQTLRTFLVNLAKMFSKLTVYSVIY